MMLLPGHDRQLVRGLRGYVLELLLQMLLVRHEVFSRLGNSVRTDTEAMEIEEKEEQDLEEKEDETKRGNAVKKMSYISFCLRSLSAEIVGCLTEFTSRSAKLHKAPLSVAFHLQAALELEFLQQALSSHLDDQTRHRIGSCLTELQAMGERSSEDEHHKALLLRQATANAAIYVDGLR